MIQHPDTHDHIGQHTPIRMEEKEKKNRKKRRKREIKLEVTKEEQTSQEHHGDKRKWEKEEPS